MTVQQLKQKIEVLQSELTTQKSIAVSRKETADSYRVVIDNLEKKCSEVDKLIVEKEVVTARVNDLEKLVQEKEVVIATHKSLAFSFMDEIHEESNDSLGDQENGQLRTSTLCLQLKDQVEIAERVKDELTKTKVELSSLQNVHRKKGKEVNSLKELIKELESKIVSQNVHRKRLEGEISELKNKSDTNSRTVDQFESLESRLCDRNAMCETLEKKLEELQIRLKCHSTTTAANLVEREQQCDPEKECSCQIKVEAVRLQYEKQLEVLKQAITVNPDTSTQLSLISKLKQVIEDKENKLNSFKEYEVFVDTALTEKMNIIKELKGDIRNLQDDSKSTCSKLSLLEKTNKTLEQKITQHSEHIKQLLKLNNLLREKVQSEQSEPLVALEEISVPVIPNNSKICFAELKIAGSCKWKGRCKYSHEIPAHLKETKAAEKFLFEKRLCVNEFRRVGSCLKGQNCRFNHKITADQRNEDGLRESMRRKMSRIKSNNACKYEVAAEGSCPFGTRCKFKHSVHLVENFHPVGLNVNETQRTSQTPFRFSP